MRLVDIVQGPWAITPSMLSEIVGIYSRHARGEKLDLKELQAKTGVDLNNAPKPYEVIDGIAVIALDGVLAKRMNLFMRISGGTSMQIAGAQVKAAAMDPEVRGIVLHIDSPGGTVDGTQELADIVSQAGEMKPVVAFADGLMASAAYWIGSAAGQVFISGDTTYVGSIGVVAEHWDVSRADDAAGIKRTEIYAGKYKRIDSDTGPLSQEGRDYIQSQVDTLYSIFVTAVASNRGVSVETVLKDMADGRLFIGQDAIARGLVDGVSTLDALIADMAAGALPVKSTTALVPAGVAVEAVHDEECSMTLDDIKTAHPELAAALEQAGYERGLAEGEASELARIKAVKAQSLPGHEALIEALMFDGKTTGPEAAAKVVEAEKAVRGAALAALKAEAPKAVPDAASVDAPAPATFEDGCKAKWDADEKLRADFGDRFDLYLADAKAVADGRTKTVTSRKAA